MERKRRAREVAWPRGPAHAGCGTDPFDDHDSDRVGGECVRGDLAAARSEVEVSRDGDDARQRIGDRRCHARRWNPRMPAAGRAMVTPALPTRRRLACPALMPLVAAASAATATATSTLMLRLRR